ncbi:MAG TPA: hypothetical protein VHW47_03975 [Acidimicrobiales bacterium]|nr:hypothetical protein [Acidimicrobiales bacterium]
MEDHELTSVGWEPLEVAAGLVTAAVTVLAAAAAIGGVLGATGPMPYPDLGDVTAAIIQEATGWATVGLVLLLGALAALWGQVRRWSAAVDGPGTATGEVGSGRTPAARRHLRRSRYLATWIGVLLLAAAAAAVAELVATFLPISPSPATALGWERYAVESGVTLAVLLGVAGGLYLVRDLTLRSRTSEPSTGGAVGTAGQPDEE